MIHPFFLAALFSTTDAEQALKTADHLSNDVQDERLILTMTVETGGETKQARMETLQKGGKKRLIRFLSPGDVKGMAILVEAPGVMYVYLPQFQKVRRVAGSQQNQGIMGTDVSNEEMGAMAYAETYRPTLVDETDDVIHLKLEPKPGKETQYEALLVTIDKKTQVISQIDSLQGGVAVRRQTRSQFKTFGTAPIPMQLVIENLMGRQEKITFAFDDVKVNTGLSDSLFTKQALERAR